MSTKVFNSTLDKIKKKQKKQEITKIKTEQNILFHNNHNDIIAVVLQIKKMLGVSVLNLFLKMYQDKKLFVIWL